MQLEEGQLYAGGVSLTGDDGPYHDWIVVSPFGRMHLHSIDDPLLLHCLPLNAAHRSLAAGGMRLVGSDPDHPVLQLQREKERRGIQDSHLGLHGEDLQGMLELLEEAVAARSPYAAYAAGEIRGLINTELCSAHEVERALARVEAALASLPN